MAEELGRQFEIPDSVKVTEGNGGMPRVVLTHESGSSAEVYIHGAHVTSWKDAEGKELFFLSGESNWAIDKPIRGGIPVCFPQFSGQGSLPPHGFARDRDWGLRRTEVLSNGIVTAELQLTETAETLELWPHQFALGLRLMLDEDALTLQTQVTNTGSQLFDFQLALHTYFSVEDIHRVSVHGLEGIVFIDSLKDGARETESRSSIRFKEETDRIYVDAPDSLRVKDEATGRAITIEKRNMPDAVVWNPWTAKAQRMPDFGDDEYLRMVCLETGTIETRPCVSPGNRWQGETTFSIQGQDR